MKFRKDFVTNSSSSSFIICVGNKISNDALEMIKILTNTHKLNKKQLDEIIECEQEWFDENIKIENMSEAYNVDISVDNELLAESLLKINDNDKIDLKVLQLE